MQGVATDLQEDRPGSGAAYLCPHPGGYRIQNGQLRPFPQAAAGPIMLVSCYLSVLAAASFLMHPVGVLPCLYTRIVQSLPMKEYARPRSCADKPCHLHEPTAKRSTAVCISLGDHL